MQQSFRRSETISINAAKCISGFYFSPFVLWPTECSPMVLLQNASRSNFVTASWAVIASLSLGSGRTKTPKQTQLHTKMRCTYMVARFILPIRFPY